jgi:hypothetical protein
MFPIKVCAFKKSVLYQRYVSYVLGKYLIISLYFFLIIQARLLELYGKFGEYDSTTNAINTEDGDEDMQVFKAKLTLKEASTHCSIRVIIILLH